MRGRSDTLHLVILYLKVFDALPDGVGGLWIAWPKKSSGVATDLSQVVVRKVGMASGLVDYKVCSIDATWTGLRFTRRKSKSAG